MIITRSFYVSKALVLSLFLPSYGWATQADISRFNAMPGIELAHSRTYWPTKDWEKAEPVPPKTKEAKMACDDFKAALIKENHNPALRAKATRPEEEPLRSDGIVVIHKGKIVFEYYDGSYNKETPHCLWSASKSISAALLGVAVRDKKIALEDTLASLIPAPKGSPVESNPLYKEIRISDLLAMQSGFKWNESYDGDLRTSSITKMLYLEGYRDTSKFALNAEMSPGGPGSQWVYNSGNVSITQAALKQVYGSAYDTFPWKALFNPIGMTHAVVERDEQGTFIGSSYVSATPREMAKFGYLYLNNGLWESNQSSGELKQMLPAPFVALARTLSPAILKPATTKAYLLSEGIYSSGGFWLNEAIPSKDLPMPFPDAPKDLFFAGGHYGQIILVMPSLDLIVARTGHDTEYWSKINRISRDAAVCFGGQKD